MWNPNNEPPHSQQVYHQQKEPAPYPYHPHWYRYPPGNQPEQPETNLIDYSSEMPADMHTHSRDQDRPFKAYPRTPVTMPGSFYTSQAAFPSMPMSVGSERDYSQVTSTCSSASSVPSVPSMSGMGGPPPLAHAHHLLHGNLRSPIETAGRPSPDSQSQSGAGMLEISSSVSLKDSPEAGDCHKGHSPPHHDNSSGSDTSPHNATHSSLDGDSPQDRHEMNSFRVPPKKRPHNMPDLPKDETYWEKRKKNNESAKRSREARRMKEEQIAMRVVYLEQENLQLRTELSLLKNEIEKLRHMLYNP